MDEFLNQVIVAFGQFGGLPAALKVASVLTLIISSMKVSVISQYLWSKLGGFQVFLAPILALIAGLLGLGMGKVPLTFAAALAYMSAGVGAVFIHQILDGIKIIPGIGPMWVSLINLIESFANPSQPPSLK